MLRITYTVKIDGRPADAALMGALLDIEVEQHCRLADMVRLRFAVAVDASGEAWSVVDEDRFKRLTRLRVEVAVGSGKAEPLIEAYVVETHATFSNQPGASVLEVVGMDATVLMNLEQKVRAWPDMTDGDIARAIFGEHSLAPQVDATQPLRQQTERTVLQRGSDIQFLRMLAERNGCLCYVEVNPATGVAEGHFHPPRVDDPPQGVLSVNLGTATTVDRFASRYEMWRPTGARADNVQIASQADQSADVSAASHPGMGRQSTVGGEKPRHVLLAGTGLAETGELQTIAQAVVDRSAFAVHAEGELTTVTYGAVLHARHPVNVRGAGRQFSGTYLVQSVLHRIAPDSYTQSFTLCRNATGVKGNEQFAETRAKVS